MAFPPVPIRLQSIGSPASLNVKFPTTTPFSDATTAQHDTCYSISHNTYLLNGYHAEKGRVGKAQAVIFYTFQ